MDAECPRHPAEHPCMCALMVCADGNQAMAASPRMHAHACTHRQLVLVLRDLAQRGQRAVDACSATPPQPCTHARMPNQGGPVCGCRWPCMHACAVHTARCSLAYACGSSAQCREGSAGASAEMRGVHALQSLRPLAVASLRPAMSCECAYPVGWACSPAQCASTGRCLRQ